MNQELKNYFAKLGRKGAKARQAVLTSSRRISIARKAAKTRWASKTNNDNENKIK